MSISMLKHTYNITKKKLPKVKLFLIAANIALLLINNITYANINFTKIPDNQTSLAPMLKQVIPAVVNIKIYNKQKYLQLLQEQAKNLNLPPLYKLPIPENGMIGMGSGVIINAKDGLIATNNHVIKDAEKIIVTLSDGRNTSAKLIGADPDTDLAVLKVTIDGLTELKFADSDKAEVGDFVLAIGSPFNLSQTVTSGIISGKGRSVYLETYEDFIQTDASINPGNSGGALINLKGELVGINTAILAPEGGSVGIGFAIPSNMSTTIIKQLLHYGKVRRGLLGVIAQPLTPELASAFGDPKLKGAIVGSIARDSVAYNSDLKVGDIIYEVDGNKINNATDLKNTIGLTPINQDMVVKYIRNSKHLSTKIKLLDPDEIQTRAQKIFPALAGAYMDPVKNITLQHVGEVNGLKLLDVAIDSPAWQQGLRNDDIILSANNNKVTSFEDLEKAITNKEKPLLLQIARKNTSYFLAIKNTA